MAAGDPQYEGSSKAIRTVRSTSAAVPVGPTDLYPAYVGQAAALWANDKSPGLDLVTMPGPTYPDAMYEGRSEAIHVFGDQPIVPPGRPPNTHCGAVHSIFLGGIASTGFYCRFPGNVLDVPGSFVGEDGRTWTTAASAATSLDVAGRAITTRFLPNYRGMVTGETQFPGFGCDVYVPLGCPPDLGVNGPGVGGQLSETDGEASVFVASGGPWSTPAWESTFDVVLGLVTNPSWDGEQFISDTNLCTHNYSPVTIFPFAEVSLGNGDTTVYFQINSAGLVLGVQGNSGFREFDPGYTAGVTYSCRIKVDAGVVWFKTWLATDPEPSTWNIDSVALGAGPTDTFQVKTSNERFINDAFYSIVSNIKLGAEVVCIYPTVLCAPETSDTYGWQGLWQTDLLNGTTFENRNGGGALIPRTIAADLQAQWNDQTVPFQDGPIDREYRQYHTYQLSGLTPAIGVRLVCPSIVASRPAVMSGATITWKLYAYSDDNWYYAFPGWFPLNAVEIASGSLVTTDDPDIHPFETTFYLPGGPSRLLQLMLVCTATEGEGDSFFMGTQYAVRPRYTFEPYWTVAANVELYGIHLYPILCEMTSSGPPAFIGGPFTGFGVTFRHQIGDPTTSLDRTVCLLESAAMVLDWQTKGAVKVWGGELVPWCGRSEAAIRAFGSNLQNAQQAWAHYGQYLDIRAGRTWDDLVARLNEGRAVILGGEYIELVTAGVACDDFTGGHAIALFPYYAGTKIFVGDPLCGDFKYIEASVLQAFATAQGVAFYGSSSPQPLYFGVSQPW